MKPMMSSRFSLQRQSNKLAGYVLAAVAGLAALPSHAADKTVASLGAVSVPDVELQRMLEAMPAAERTNAKGNRQGLENWLRQRVVAETVLRQARGKGWADRPEIKARVDAAVREVTARIVTSAYLESVAQVPPDYPSDAEVAAAYEQGRANFKLPPTYRVAQIYLAAGTDNGNAQRATALAAQARSGDFAALARAQSQDKASAERGGEVGTLALADLLPEIRSAVSSMKVGQVSEPIQAASGWHIVKLLDQQPARNATLEEMTPRLKLALRQQRQQQLVREYLAAQAPADQVKIDGAVLDTVLKNAN